VHGRSIGGGSPNGWEGRRQPTRILELLRKGGKVPGLFYKYLGKCREQATTIGACGGKSFQKGVNSRTEERGGGGKTRSYHERQG